MLRPVVCDAAAAALEHLEAARNVLRQEAAAVAAVADRLDAGFAHVVALLADCEGCVIVTGIGKSGLVGRKIVATLASTGTPAHFLHPAEAVHGDLGRVTSADCVLAFSHGGESAELVRILPSIRERGASIAAVCSRAGSSLVRAADAAVVYGSIEEACPLGMAPSTSCLVAQAIGDALAFTLMRMKGFDAEQFHRVHPSGSLGRLGQPVGEVMRVGRELRIAPCGRSVRQVFVETKRVGRRTGAILLVDADGRLAGLFTDSDLARLIERQEADAFEQPISEYMTRRPIVLQDSQTVRDAVDLLRDRHVSELPVLDAAGRPVGIVDVTDVMDLLPDLAEAA